MGCMYWADLSSPVLLQLLRQPGPDAQRLAALHCLLGYMGPDPEMERQVRSSRGTVLCGFLSGSRVKKSMVIMSSVNGCFVIAASGRPSQVLVRCPAMTGHSLLNWLIVPHRL